MFTHTYLNLQYAILHSLDWRRADGRLIHDHFDTIYYDDIVWC